MALKDFVIYWTDGLNPPRQLAVSGAVGPGLFPFPALREEFLPELDIAEEDVDIYEFSTRRFTYSTSTGLTVFSTGNRGLFADLPEGIRVAFVLSRVSFWRRGIRSHVDYTVATETPNYDPQQSVPFPYDGCALDPDQDLEIKHEFTDFGGHVIDSFSSPDSVFVQAGRIDGGFVVYFPCNWHVKRTIAYRHAAIHGWAVVPRDQIFTYNPQIRTALFKWWPRTDEEDAPEGS